MAPCRTVSTLESGLFQVSTNWRISNCCHNFRELLPYFLCLINSCVVQYELRPRWPLGEEYSEGRSVARSLKTARVHPSLTSMIQGSLQKQLSWKLEPIIGLSCFMQLSSPSSSFRFTNHNLANRDLYSLNWSNKSYKWAELVV